MKLEKGSAAEAVEMLKGMETAHAALTAAVTVLLNAGSYPPLVTKQVQDLLAQARRHVQGLGLTVFPS